MKRTAEELAARRAKRMETYEEDRREARRREAKRARRVRMDGGDLLASLKLTRAEERGLVLDAPRRRETWARMGTGRSVREVEPIEPSGEAQAAE